MLTSVHPKLPMRDREATRAYYIDKLGFRSVGDTEYPDYLIVERENVQLHFFLFRELEPKENYGQVYIRTDDIDGLYRHLLGNGIAIHPNGALQARPDNNLLTFGQPVRPT